MTERIYTIDRPEWCSLFHWNLAEGYADHVRAAADLKREPEDVRRAYEFIVEARAVYRERLANRPRSVPLFANSGNGQPFRQFSITGR